MRILVIYNPVSGTEYNRYERIGKTVFRLGAGGNELIMHQTAPGEKISDWLSENYNTCRPDSIVACGGDGTLHHVMNAVLNVCPSVSIGYVPLGSTNDYAQTLGINPRNAEKRIISGKTSGFDVGFMEGEYFSYVAAFGSIAEVSYKTPQDLKNSIGHLAYVLEGLMVLPRMAKNHIRFKTDKGEFEDDFVLGFVMNSLSVGGMKLTVADATSFNDGFMEYLFIKYPENLFDLQAIMMSLAQSKMDEKYMYFGSSSSFTIDSDPMEWTLDGEAGGEFTHAAIQVVRQKMRLFV